MKREEMDAEIQYLDGVTCIDYKTVPSKTNDQILLGLVAKNKDGTEKFYNPEGFVFVKLNQLIKPLDSETDLSERARSAINAKMQITHLVESIKQQERYFKTKEVDYSGTYKRLEGIVDATKIDLELETRILNNEFISKQKELIQSQIDTNTNVASTNKNVIIILCVTAAIYLVQLLVSIYGINSNNDKTQTQLQQKQIQLINQILQAPHVAESQKK